jgi:hypothetical protein
VTPVAELDRKLHELDVRLRAGTLSRADYRKVRRKAIVALEDPHVTIPHGLDPSQDETIENTTPTRPLPPDPPTLPGVPIPAPTASNGKIVWIFAVIGALVALAVAVLLLIGSGKSPPSPAPLAGIRDAGAPAAGTPASGPALPQTVVERFTKSEWTDADIAAFLSTWNGIPPESRRAARDDQGLWLLRGETDRRLRAAVDAAALDPTPEAQSRIDRLTALQTALRPE